MRTRERNALAIAAAMVVFSPALAHAMGSSPPWQEEFGIAKCNLLTSGRNEYFILEPGFRLELEGGDTRLQITVLNETRMVNGVNTRVVEEREWKKGKLHEVSRNYFALCEQTKDLFYFGEDVEMYKDGRKTSSEGSWVAGANGNKPGLIMPGTPKAGMRYYQEVAPGIAMDRAEIVSLAETCSTPAGAFRCMKVKETSGIEFFAKEYKYHAPGIGLVKDDDVQLVRHGFVKIVPSP